MRRSNWLVSSGSLGLLRKLLATPDEATAPATFGLGNSSSSFLAIGSKRPDGIWLLAKGCLVTEPSAATTVLSGSKIGAKPEKSPLRHVAGGTEARNVCPVRTRVPW